MRMRKKPNLVPRMERCARFLIQAPEEQRGHWRELKPDAEQIWLELGCGKGRFTAETAAQNPNVLYLAVERVPDAMIVAMERCAQRSLTNVFFVDGDAARLREYFAPDEVDRLFINFCDPWPSNRHARRRLTHQNFLVLYRGVLCTGGQIHFKTDNRDLFEYSLFQFPKAGYALSEVTRDLHANGIRGVMTDYGKIPQSRHQDQPLCGDEGDHGPGAGVSSRSRPGRPCGAGILGRGAVRRLRT